MEWRVGCWYRRRNGELAMFHGLSFNIPVFFHPDLVTDYSPSGLLAHHWNGKVAAARAIRPWCRPYDIITDITDVCVVL